MSSSGKISGDILAEPQDRDEGARDVAVFGDDGVYRGELFRGE